MNSQDVGGWSALHEAAYAGREDFIELLLSSGANVNIQNSDGATPIFTAAQYGNVSCLKLLLKNGGDINLLTVDNASPLFIAAQEGFTSCINVLLGASKYLLKAFLTTVYPGKFCREHRAKVLSPCVLINLTILLCNILNMNCQSSE